MLEEERQDRGNERCEIRNWRPRFLHENPWNIFSRLRRLGSVITSLLPSGLNRSLARRFERMAGYKRRGRDSRLLLTLPNFITLSRPVLPFLLFTISRRFFTDRDSFEYFNLFRHFYRSIQEIVQAKEYECLFLKKKKLFLSIRIFSQLDRSLLKHFLSYYPIQARFQISSPFTDDLVTIIPPYSRTD